MQFLIDAQLPPSLADQIVALGHEATHVANVGMLTSSDRDIWHYAAKLNAVLVTKDEDFVTMRAFHTTGPAVVWIRVGNMRNRELFPIFVASFPAILAALSRGETVVEFSGF